MEKKNSFKNESEISLFENLRIPEIKSRWQNSQKHQQNEMFWKGTRKECKNLSSKRNNVHHVVFVTRCLMSGALRKYRALRLF